MTVNKHDISRDELVTAIALSYGYLTVVAENITKLRERDPETATVVDRFAARRAIDRLDKAGLAADPEGYRALQQQLEDEGDRALESVGFKMTHAAISGDMKAMKYLLDRRGGEKWRREEAIVHKGADVTVKISKDEDGI